MENSDLLAAAIQAAQAAGRVLSADRFGVIRAEGKDLKSTADLAAERTIFEFLDPIGLPVISEETRLNAGGLAGGRCWIVDPLDGTLNFTRGIPLFCVSIGLWDNGAPVLGVIHEPLTERTYVGLVGQGASLNGDPIRVAEVEDPAQAVLCTGFPTGRSYSAESLARFIDSVQRFKKVRLLGSAALCLAFLGAGLVDAYCEDDIWLWDVAAGLAIVKAAGGTFQCGPWGETLKTRVVATNGALGLDQVRG